MSKTNKLIRASDLKLGEYLVIGTDDYEIVNLNAIIGEDRTAIVAIPLNPMYTNSKQRELQLVVPNDTELIVLK